MSGQLALPFDADYELVVTGARDGHPHAMAVLDSVVRGYGVPSRLHVGDARGVDWWAQQWARHRGVPCDPVLAPWDELGDAAGMLRNGWVLDAARPGALCVGLPFGESPGTRGCMRLALARGFRVLCADYWGVLSPVVDPRDVRLGRRRVRRRA